VELESRWCKDPTGIIGYTEPSITGLRRDLNAYVTYYNQHRPHHGRWNQGATPATIMVPNPKLHP
jgi:hypothetical protein